MNRTAQMSCYVGYRVVDVRTLLRRTNQNPTNSIRVVSRNGQALVVSTDYRAHRLNVEEIDGIISRVVGWF